MPNVTIGGLLPATNVNVNANVIDRWFEQKQWRPFEFQREAWQAYLDGASGLIHASTGTGKTLAAWLGPVAEWLMEHELTPQIEQPVTRLPAKRHPVTQSSAAPPLRVLWVTPLRALADDTEKSLREPIEQMDLSWTVERRTGDTSSHIRARQKKKLPTTLITTPESLELMLSWSNARERFSTLRCVIVDEWHELLSSKRGTLVELALARLRRWNPSLRTWGMSATLGNLDVAMQALVGRFEFEGWKVGNSATNRPTLKPSPVSVRLVRGELPKDIIIDSLIPNVIERFPWAGHLGLVMLPHVISAISENKTTLIFTN